MAQSDHSLKGKSSVYLELLGNGGFYSINYDRIFYHEENDALVWRAGAHYFPLGDRAKERFGSAVLGEVMHLWGKGPHFLESGIGLTHFISRDWDVKWYLVPRIGYRYQPIKRGLLFRIGFTPLIPLHNYSIGFRTIFSAGVSVGYTFKAKG